MIKTILIPVDGSANSATAVDYGIYIAPKLEATLDGTACHRRVFNSGTDDDRYFRHRRHAAL